jgi:hypothetical protein
MTPVNPYGLEYSSETSFIKIAIYKNLLSDLTQDLNVQDLMSL